MKSRVGAERPYLSALRPVSRFAGIPRVAPALENELAWSFPFTVAEIILAVVIRAREPELAGLARLTICANAGAVSLAVLAAFRG